MDKYLKSDRFETNPTLPDSKRKWQHWITTFTVYLNSIKGVSDENNSIFLSTMLVHRYTNKLVKLKLRGSNKKIA